MASVRIIEATSRVSGKVTGYKVRWREGGRGTKERSSPVFKLKSDASAFSERKKIEVESNRSLTEARRSTELTMREIITRYVNARVARGKILPEYAAHRIEQIAKLCEARDWVTTAKVTASSVNDWQTQTAGRGMRSGAYLRAVLQWASQTLGQTVDQTAVRELLPRAAVRRHRRHRPTAQNLEAWQALADAYGANASAFVHCLRTYGWRPLMAAKLMVGDVDLSRGWITLSRMKNGDDLEHPLSAVTIERLKAIVAGRGNSEPLFLDPRTGLGWLVGTEKRPANMKAPSNWWRLHIESGTGKGIYQLKREAISLMLERGMSPESVRHFTGHRTISQVLVYAVSNDESKLRALRILDQQEESLAENDESKGAQRAHGSN